MLRFLLLEDNAIDAQLIQHILKRIEFGYEVVWVKTRVEFLAALDSETISLILADYNLPEFTGAEALAFVKQHYPDIPFIVVSGSLGEELAIEMLKQGATDYVLKQRLERLVPAVNRALQEAQEHRQRQRAERMLVEQKRLLELIATGHPLNECLTAVCTSISQLNPHIRACFLLTDAQRQTFLRSIAPEFPPSFGEGLKDAPIDDLCIGTCGEAVYRGEPITCADIANDDYPSETLPERWSQEWRNLCIAHGISACHSKPVMGIDGLPFGSLMLCFDEARQPTEWEYQLVEFGTQVASIVFERDRSNLALRASEERFRAIVDQATAGITLTDLTGQFMLVNQRYCDIVGYSKEELLQKRMQDITHPDDLSHNSALFNQLVAEGREFVVEKRYIRQDGSEVWVNNSVSIIRDASGNPQSAVAVVLDISDRQQAEQQLRESRAFLTHITDVAPIILYVYDLCETRNVWSNNNLALVLGYTPDEVQAMGANVLSQLLHPEDVKRYPAHFERLSSLQPDEVAEFEYRMRHKDGSWHWLSSREMAYLQNDDGTVKQIVGAAHDITARKQANERLHLLYETTSELLATEQPLALMNTLFSKLSAQLDLHYYFNFLIEEQDNQRKLHLTHHSEIPKDVIAQIEWIEFGQDICGMAAQEQRQIVLDQTQIATYPNAQLAHLLGITAYACQPLMVRGRLLGTLSFASLTRTHFTPEETDLLQSVCEQMAIALDRSNLTRSIQQQAERLQEANRIKDEFLAVLSHELRSPLNPILGWTRLLQNGNLDAARQREALVTIERNAKLQTQLIEDLLDISRIMQGKLTLTAAPVNLTFVISAAVETVRLAAEAKHIQILLDLSTFVAPVSGDAARLQQVVWNLLTNAVKFTSNQGQVTVELRQLDQIAQIQVTDTGKGISPDFLPYVFEYFRQADLTTTRKFGGLGLGLAIVRQIVEMHGGTVKAESLGDNQGATFTVQLPILQQAILTTPEPTHFAAETVDASLSNLQILLVDDDEDAREFQAFLLEQHGARVIAAASGLEALQWLDQFVPDAIVSDIGMADMDGYMLMQQIRSRPPDQGGQIPAIALTAYAGEYDQQKVLAAGFNHHISKPIESEYLIQTISKLLFSGTPL
jgi:PAS domain S-box-containing protein